MEPFEVEIENESGKVPFNAEAAQQLLQKIAADAGFPSGRIEVLIIDDPSIHRLNVQFLGHDYPTDVLAFEMEKDEDAGYLEGNIAVSDETAADRAAEYGWPAENELLLYVVHGMLHLVGYDDHSPEDEPQMRAKEREYLASVGIESIAAPEDLGKKED